MADKDEMISHFTNLTNVDVERARFYLESSAWQLEVALASFYENNEDEDIQEIRQPPDEPEIVEEVPRRANVEPEAPAEKAKKPKSAPSSRFGTLANLQGSDDSSDGDEGQAFYAGGSEHSGQQILGPSKKKKDFVSEMFKSVREQGAEVVDPRQPSSSKKSQVFSGAGYRLGQTAADAAQVVASTSAPVDTSPVQITLRMYRAGFTVNNGQLRDYKVPANLQFLNSVNNGEIPAELAAQARGRELQLEMEDHRQEEFVAPKTKTQAFTGAGRLLGSPAPATVVSAAEGQDNTKCEEDARTAVALDTSQPTTTVQVRLADGSRLVGTFNHTHTIANLRSYIATARPQFQQQAYQLRTVFPSVELSDESKTLSDAGLLNSAVLQRLV